MPELVKICPNCETRNGAHDSFCAQCDWDLINVPAHIVSEAASKIEIEAESATEAQNPEKRAVCTLELLENPQIRFEIGDGQSVGRSNRADVILKDVPQNEWISRVHARFFRRGEQWFAQYLAQGNFLKVDGEEFRDDSEIALHDGSMVSFSMTTFVFRSC